MSLAHLRHDVNPHEHDPNSETPWPPYCIMPDYYTYLAIAVDPPRDSCYQCHCAHVFRIPESDGDEDDPDHSQQELYTVRCTNSFTQQDYAAGWTLCTDCRPTEELIYAWAFQIRFETENIIANNQIILNPTLHYGYYAVLVRERLRQREVQCRCYCPRCNTGGNSLRRERDFTDTARRIAREDVDAFISGDLPIPSRRFYTLQNEVLRRR